MFVFQKAQKAVDAGVAVNFQDLEFFDRPDYVDAFKAEKKLLEEARSQVLAAPPGKYEIPASVRDFKPPMVSAALRRLWTQIARAFLGAVAETLPASRLALAGAAFMEAGAEDSTRGLRRGPSVVASRRVAQPRSETRFGRRGVAVADRPSEGLKAPWNSLSFADTPSQQRTACVSFYIHPCSASSGELVSLDFFSSAAKSRPLRCLRVGF